MDFGNQNYSFSSPHSSTPSAGVRMQRPRFGYSGPTMYPRPRSSASKPNPEGYSHNRSSMGGASNGDSHSYNNYDLYENNSYNNSFHSQGSNSEYYSCPESFCESPYPYAVRRKPVDYRLQNDNSQFSPKHAFSNDANGNTGTFMNSGFFKGNFPSNNNSNHVQNMGYKGNFPSNKLNPRHGPNMGFKGNVPNYHIQSPPVYRANFQGNHNNTAGTFENSGSSKGNFQKSFRSQQNTPFNQRRKVKARRTMENKVESNLKCDLCNIQFTSSIPMEMHLRGNKHTKKMKLQFALEAIQTQVEAKDIDPVGKSFRCELCNLTLNSSLQLQMHLEGNKHKNKILQQEKKATEGAEDSAEQGSSEKKPSEIEAEINSETKAEGNSDEIKSEIPQQNGKSSLVRPLPTEFDMPRPSKMSKFSCDLCNVFVNSNTQLQQHLESKRHQAKVEGKPWKPKKKMKQVTNEADASDNSEVMKDEPLPEAGDENVDTSAAEETAQSS